MSLEASAIQPVAKVRKSASGDLANLDILRTFAVLLVVVSHFMMYDHIETSAHWMGLAGVCLFFVHTSLVLMWSLGARSAHRTFYVRRAFRLFPLGLSS